MIKKYLLRWLAACTLLLGTFLSGCSVFTTHTDSDASLPVRLGQMNPQPDQEWWQYPIRLNWNQSNRPDFSLDLLLADQIFEPILEDYYMDLPFWRFHRRAAPDKSGHAFSLLFYTTSEVAQDIFTRLQNNVTLQALIDAGVVAAIPTADSIKSRGKGIAATSDVGWSPELQQHWPPFIMGVSAMWLGLINEKYANVQANEGQTIDSMLSIYREVDSQLDDIWRREGQHALLHHLNALFGYEPLVIKRLMTF